jgi:hypothetical protein
VPAQRRQPKGVVSPPFPDIVAGSANARPLNDRHDDFARRANLPQPDGYCSYPQISGFLALVSFPIEGRFAIVTDVGNGMRWTRQRQAQFFARRMTLPRTAKSCGPGAPMQALKSLVSMSPATDGGNQAWSPRRSRISRKTIAQGRPDDPPVPVVLPRAFLLHADHGCGGHPVFPAPSFSFEGGFASNSSDAICAARMRIHVGCLNSDRDTASAVTASASKAVQIISGAGWSGWSRRSRASQTGAGEL